MHAFDAKVLFAGLAPGFAGLMRVNAQIPLDVNPSNRLRVAVGFGWNVKPVPAAIAVR